MALTYVKDLTAAILLADLNDTSYCEYEHCPRPAEQDAPRLFVDATCAPVRLGQGYFHTDCYEEANQE